MQLCALRYLEFVPEDLKFAPLEAIRFVADQLRVSSSVLETYGGREQTQGDHFGEVREHLGYSLPRPQDYEGLLEGLLDRALEHDKAILLLRLACDRLRAQRIVRPPGDRLVRLVGTARQEAQSKTFRLLEPLLTPTRRAQLDHLLTTQHPRGRSRLAWLGEGAGGENPSAIKGELYGTSCQVHPCCVCLRLRRNGGVLQTFTPPSGHFGVRCGRGFRAFAARREASTQGSRSTTWNRVGNC